MSEAHFTTLAAVALKLASVEAEILNAKLAKQGYRSHSDVSSKAHLTALAAVALNPASVEA